MIIRWSYHQKAAAPAWRFPDAQGAAKNALWGGGQRSTEERPTLHGGKPDAPLCISLPPKGQSLMLVVSLRKII